MINVKVRYRPYNNQYYDDNKVIVLQCGDRTDTEVISVQN